MRRDRLAAGAASESYGPIAVSQEKWESIFGEPEVGLFKKKIRKPKASKKIQDEKS